MKNHKELIYYKIGSFVLVGISILIAGILILGSGKLFEKTIYFETYFNESVQGISIGSSVKYRGLDIGHVDKIAFVNEIYKSNVIEKNKPFNRYIYVRMAINSPSLTNLSTQALKNMFSHEITQGLRVQITPQGLTGNAYLELNYVSPEANPIIKIDWTPHDNYIPTVKSTLGRFSDSLSIILTKLQTVDFGGLAKKISGVTVSTNRVLDQTSILLSKTTQNFSDMVSGFQKVADNMLLFSDRIKSYPPQLLFSGPPPKIDMSKL
jgi:phospholipid/cholesterol/gamma-HCH transport system substrate-binding protein/paraquat-inducible protein B